MTRRKFSAEERRKFSAEEKIRIMLEGLRGEESIAELAAVRATLPATRTILSYTPVIGGGRTRMNATVSRKERETWLFSELVVLSAAAEVRLVGQPAEGVGKFGDDQALSRYPVLKIHPTAATHTIKKAIIMTRLTPALISEVP